jgi:DNA-binding GntR family transcriptional regulator
MATNFLKLDVDPALRSRRTTSDYVAEALRTAILAGRFKDGEELNQVELAEHFGVSRVPVREALRQLQAEGLIEAQAHRRAVVTGFSPERILEMFELRKLLEGFLLEKATPNIDEERLARLRRLCDEMDATEDRREWLGKNREFHATLYEPSGARITLDFNEQLMLRLARYLQGAGFVDPVEAGADHRRILDTIERGDFAGARRELEQHIERTRNRLEERLRQEEARLHPAG